MFANFKTGSYTVSLRSYSGTLPSPLNVVYLGFSGKIDVNGLSSKVDVARTKASSSLTPFSKYLSYSEDGEVDWQVGMASSVCAEGNQTPIIFGDQVQDELFSIFVNAGPGETVGFTDLTATIQICTNNVLCSSDVPVIFNCGPLVFPTFLDCDTETLSFRLAFPAIIVSLKTPSGVVNSLDGVVQLRSMAMGSTSIKFTPYNIPGGFNPMNFDSVKYKNGDMDIHFSNQAQYATSGTRDLFAILVYGYYNGSVSTVMNCTASGVRIAYNNGNICLPKSTPTNLSTPGYTACPNNLKITGTTIVEEDCEVKFRFLITHESENPVRMSRFKLLINFATQNTAIVGRSFSTTLPPSDPVPNVGLKQISSNLWRYTYHHESSFDVENNSVIEVSFNAPTDCIHAIVWIGEAIPDEASDFCGFNVPPILPGCDPTILARVSDTKSNAASNYYIYVKNNDAPPYELYTQKDCNDSWHTFCPDFTKAPFDLGIESISTTWDDNICGVTTTDMALISRHIAKVAAGLPPSFIAPYQFLAANVDYDNEIDGDDLLFIQKLILGINLDLPAPTWWYYPTTYQLPAAVQGHADLWNQRKIALPGNGQGVRAAFFAVKSGDVNRSCQKCDLSQPIEGEEMGTINLVYSVLHNDSKRLWEVPITLQDDVDILAFQGALRFDPSLFRLKEIVPNRKFLSDENFNINLLDQGELRALWYAEDGIKPMPAGSLIFTLVFEALSASPLQPPVLWKAQSKVQNLVYDDQEKEAHLDLISKMTAAATFGLMAQPNPFVDMVTLLAFSTKEVSIPIRIVNFSGQLLLEQKVNLSLGENKVQIDMSHVAPGVYFLEALAPGHSTKTKIIKL